MTTIRLLLLLLLLRSSDQDHLAPSDSNSCQAVVCLGGDRRLREMISSVLAERQALDVPNCKLINEGKQ